MNKRNLTHRKMKNFTASVLERDGCDLPDALAASSSLRSLQSRSKRSSVYELGVQPVHFADTHPSDDKERHRCINLPSQLHSLAATCGCVWPR